MANTESGSKRGRESDDLADLYYQIGRTWNIRDDVASSDVAQSIAELALQALHAGAADMSADVHGTVTAMIVELDRKIAYQIDDILHHADFQRLEATWRGLWYLCSSPRGDAGVRIQVMNVRRRELDADLRDPAQSAIHQQLALAAAGVPGAPPVAAVMADFELEIAEDSLPLLRRLARLGEAAQTVVVVAAPAPAAGMVGLPSATAQAWSTFRRERHARHLCIAMPGVLVRRAHRLLGEDPASFGYRESSDHPLRATAVWAVGATILATRSGSGWFAALEDVAGVVEDEVDAPTPTDVPLSPLQARHLSKVGCTALVARVGTGELTLPFPSTPHLDATIDRTGIEHVAPSSGSDLCAMLCACHVAQQVALRWNDGARFLSGDPQDDPSQALVVRLEQAIRRWLRSLVADQGAPTSTEAPLRDAILDVALMPDGRALVHLAVTPSYGFDVGPPVNIELALVAPTNAGKAMPAPGAERADRQPPFSLDAAVPCERWREVLDRASSVLDAGHLPPWRLLAPPLAVTGSIDTNLSAEALVDWLASDGARLSVGLGGIVVAATFDTTRLGFLGVYASGAVRGIDATIAVEDGICRLVLNDALALFDPQRPEAPSHARVTRAKFDLLILEAC